MPAHNEAKELFKSPLEKISSTTAETLVIDSNPTFYHLDSATTETRTLPRPDKVGCFLTLHHRTNGGNITVTVTGGYDVAGNTTLVFSGVGQVAVFQSCATSAGVLFWRKLSADFGTTTDVISQTTSSLTVTEALHNKKIILLDLAAGIAVTLPAAKAGLDFTFIIKTTFTGAATIKSVSGADIMIGHATMGNDSNNNTVDFQATAANTYDTIDMFGAANSTGGIEGQIIRIKGLAANLWWVEIQGDAAGTEATPFQDTVA